METFHAESATRKDFLNSSKTGLSSRLSVAAWKLSVLGGRSFFEEMRQMSISVMSKVWTYSKAERGDLLVMLAIADFANDDGEAWPSVKVLGIKSRIKERQVHYALNKLCCLGELEIVPNAGPNRCNLYKVLTCSEGGAIVAGVQKMHPAQNSQEGALDGKNRVHSTAPKPSIEPPIKPSIGKPPPKGRPNSATEVVDYAKSRGLSPDIGEAYWDKMEAGGWMRGKVKIADWKASFRDHVRFGWLDVSKQGNKKEEVTRESKPMGWRNREDERSKYA
jgi:hypothetical protein